MGTDKSPSGGEKRRFSLRALLKAHPEYWYVLFVPAYLLCFAVVERLVPSDADYWVSYCRLDDFIPFCEVFGSRTACGTPAPQPSDCPDLRRRPRYGAICIS
jgi:hypothetical protein